MEMLHNDDLRGLLQPTPTLANLIIKLDILNNHLQRMGQNQLPN